MGGRAEATGISIMSSRGRGSGTLLRQPRINSLWTMTNTLYYVANGKGDESRICRHRRLALAGVELVWPHLRNLTLAHGAGISYSAGRF